ncbi:MAG: hypothetical protein H7263_06955, partial [Candidatus Sericytochromatia bacterium]|nr:hypothetical protein [Candidatus Sericytochromatia bacterium]
MSIPASALRPTTIPTTNKSTKPIAKEKPDSEDDENTTSDKKNNNDYDPEDNPIKNAQNMAEGLKSNVETSKGASKLIKPAKVIAVVEELNLNPVDIGISFNPSNDKKVILPSEVQEKLYSGSQSLEKPLVFPKDKKKSAVTKVFEDLEANEKLFKQAKVDKKTGFVSEIGLLSKLNKGIGGLGAITGTLEVGQGIKEFARGEKYEGGFKIVEGSVSIVGGGALATGAVIGGVAVAPIAAGVGAVLYVGHAGNNRTKELDLFKDSKGESRTAIGYVGYMANETNNKITKKTGSRIAGAVATHTAVNLQIGIGTAATLGTGTAQVLRDTGNMVIDGVKITGKSTKFVGKATVGFVGKVGNGVGNKTKLAGA